MCLITVKTINSELPKDEHLIEGESTNSDGIGIGYWKSGSNEVAIKKDFFNIHMFLNWFHENIKKEDACIIHFRWATHGLKDAGNRHPFPITKNKELLRKTDLVCQMAVAHNGVISDYARHVKFSDTQKFVLDILSDDSIKNNIDSPAIRKLVSNFLGNDRLSILNNKGEIYLFGDFEKEGDIFYSNGGYQTYKYSGNFLGFRDNRRSFVDDEEKTQKETKFLNSTITEEYEGFTDVCEGCKQKKFVRYIEIKNDTGEEFTALLCKKCRRAIRTGQLIVENSEEKEEKIEGDEICDMCQATVSKGLIVETPQTGSKMCARCAADFGYNY